MKTFNLPDLGEGLPDAEIVNWLVKEGDVVSIDQPMVEMETAKAVVEVPAPFSGTVTQLHGQPGDIIQTGAPLIEFETDECISSNSSKAQDENSQPEPEASSEHSNSTAAEKDQGLEVFNLPDLGEGLPDAEIVNWLVAEGDSVNLDQPMVEMETAKAVVEVPAPHSGIIHTLHGKAGDIIQTGAPLVSFSLEGTSPQKANKKSKVREDAGTVVGSVEVGNTITAEQTTQMSGTDAKITPVIRGLAKKLGVDLSKIKATGKDNTMTQSDVRNALKNGVDSTPSQAQPKQVQAASTKQQTSNPLAFRASPAVRAHANRLGINLQQCIPSGVKGTITKADVDKCQSKTPASIPNVPMNASAPVAPEINLSGKPEPVRGARRAMAQAMTASHNSIVPVTLMDDADISTWPKGTDATARMLRAICYASKVEPAINSWFDGDKMERLMHPQVHVGIAVDTPAGLYVPVLRDADSKDAATIRKDLDSLMDQIKNKTIKPDQLSGGTISLSNYGTIAGRYGTPIVTIPQVAILGAGRYRDELKITASGISKHRMLPLSLSFDHRACTGGEGARFLAAVITDLQSPV